MPPPPSTNPSNPTKPKKLPLPQKPAPQTTASLTAATAAQKPAGHPEMQQEIDRRERAARSLGSWELLAWFAGAEGESLPQTRLRFQKEMAGVEDKGDEWEDEGDVPPDAGKGAGGKGGSAAEGKRVGKRKGANKKV